MLAALHPPLMRRRVLSLPVSLSLRYLFAYHFVFETANVDSEVKLETSLTCNSFRRRRSIAHLNESMDR